MVEGEFLSLFFVSLAAFIVVGAAIVVVLTTLLPRRMSQRVELTIEQVVDRHGQALTRDFVREIDRLRLELAAVGRSQREELTKAMREMADDQRKQLESISTEWARVHASQDRRLFEVQEIVAKRLDAMHQTNNERLEAMRQTVEEKLQGTLDRRIGESFKLVSSRLEEVQRGLGEMQNLATGVGDLKRVLTNVKTRGTWGEAQLSVILEQILTPDQYEANSKLGRKTSEVVEFAVKLPGRDDENSTVYLPIDAKFPQESYQRIVAAQDAADADALQLARRELELAIKSFAKDVRDKYIHPPGTTDFGIIFLPTEGLYAEVLRIPGILERMQNEYRVMLAGPTTLAALLNSLQLGFRTLAIQKRSSEVWKVLGTVKSEFGKFGDLLDSVQKTLTTAANKIEDATKKSRTIENKLRDVTSLPVLPLDASHSALASALVPGSSDY